MIAVHGIVTPDHRGKTAALQFVEHILHGAQRGFRTAWRGIASVQKRMQVNMLRTALYGQVHHGMNMIFMAVHTTR